LPAQAAFGGGIPAALTRIIGRKDIIETVTSTLLRRGLVAIVGPGGIGKTTVAAGVADAARASYPDGVWFVGLATLQSPEVVPSALGSAFGVTLPGSGDPITTLPMTGSSYTEYNTSVAAPASLFMPSASCATCPASYARSPADHE
jgi:hypothetical protein